MQGRIKTKKPKRNGGGDGSNKLPTINNRLGNRILDLSTKQRGFYTSFFDRQGNTSTSSTVSNTSILQPLLDATGLLALNDSMVVPIRVNSALNEWTSRVMLEKIDVRLRFLNALSNGVVAGDTYNLTRAFLHVSGSTYLATTASPLTNVLEFYDPEDVQKVLFDETVPTTISAFDSTDDGAPTHFFKAFTVQCNTILDCVTTTNRTTWDTKAGDVQFSVISDSAVIPHPTVDWAFRVHYRVLNDQ